jgi:hypothetical protein
VVLRAGSVDRRNLIAGRHLRDDVGKTGPDKA